MSGKATLLCDLGGTHARFARLEGRGVYADFRKYRLHEFETFAAIIDRYGRDSGRLFDQARFALARIPDNGVISYKRYAGDPDFTIDFNALKTRFGWTQTLFLNDLEAGAHGVRCLGDTHAETVIRARETADTDPANKIVISVGTGVGHAGIMGNAVLKTLGGHVLPVTVTEEHRRLESFIRARKPADLSPIMEDFVSARGLRMMAEYVSGAPNGERTPDEFMDDLKQHPDAVRLFFELLGIHAHMLAGLTGFYGGIYIAGGVIDHLVAFGLTDWPAFERFFRVPMVPPVAARLNACPVLYVTHPELPLLGLTDLLHHA